MMAPSLRSAMIGQQKRAGVAPSSLRALSLCFQPISSVFQVRSHDKDQVIRLPLAPMHVDQGDVLPYRDAGPRRAGMYLTRQPLSFPYCWKTSGKSGGYRLRDLCGSAVPLSPCILHCMPPRSLLLILNNRGGGGLSQA